MSILQQFINHFGIILSAIFVSGVFAITIVEYRLRTKFPDVWESLGKPNIFMIWRWNSQSGIPSFLNEKRYLYLNDDLLVLASRAFIFIASLLLVLIAIYVMSIVFDNIL